MLCQDCFIKIASFLSYKSLINLYLTSKQFNFCNELIQKKVILIQRRFRHFLSGKKSRSILSCNNYVILYNFKPFVISRIFDRSNLYIYRKNNLDFLNKIILHLTIIHDRRDENENNSTLLTTNQLEIFSKFFLQKQISRNTLKKLLDMLSISQLSYIR